MQRRKYVEADLIEAVATSISIAGVLRKLGLKPAGGNYRILKDRINSMSLDTSHFRGQGWLKGLNIRQSPLLPLSKVLVKGVRKNSSHLRSRLIKEGVKEAKCEICGNAEWNGESIPIELDHINGDSCDNRLENLRVVCPNCHAQTNTYRGKNIRIG